MENENQKKPIENDSVNDDPISELSDKHSLFLDHYLKSFNGTRSYMAVYPGATEESAAVLASNLLRNVKIIEEKKRRIQELKEQIPDEVVPYLKNHMMFNIADFLDENGRPDLKKIKENNIPGLVTNVSFSEDSYRQGDGEEIIKTKKSFKLTDQQKSIELISKILKLYEENSGTSSAITLNFIPVKSE